MELARAVCARTTDLWNWRGLCALAPHTRLDVIHRNVSLAVVHNQPEAWDRYTLSAPLGIHLHALNHEKTPWLRLFSETSPENPNTTKSFRPLARHTHMAAVTHKQSAPRTRQSSHTLAAFQPWGSFARWRRVGSHPQYSGEG